MRKVGRSRNLSRLEHSLPGPLHLFPAFVNISIVWRRLRAERAKPPSSRDGDRDWYKWPRSNLSNPFRRLSLWKEGGETDEKRDRWMVETWKDGCQFDLSLSRLSVSSFPESGFVFCGQRAAAECADCSRPSGGHASRVADTFWDTLYDFRTQIC